MVVFLDNILEHKKAEVGALQTKHPLFLLRKEVESTLHECRPFKQALVNRIQGDVLIPPFEKGGLGGISQTAIIAEIKQASPSVGLMTQHFDPPLLAKTYETHGAACISVLTDAHFFKGSLQDLVNVKAVTTLPILRKDFIIDPYQVWESKKSGADAILLIVGALDPGLCQDLMMLANALHLDVLLEIHSAKELTTALQMESTAILGINNRNLHSFEVSLKTTLDLFPTIPPGRVVVSESGIKTRGDIVLLQQAGLHAFLVGETLMTSQSPGNQLTTLLGLR